MDIRKESTFARNDDIEAQSKQSQFSLVRG